MLYTLKNVSWILSEKETQVDAKLPEHILCTGTEVESLQHSTLNQLLATKYSFHSLVCLIFNTPTLPDPLAPLSPIHCLPYCELKPSRHPLRPFPLTRLLQTQWASSHFLNNCV